MASPGETPAPPARDDLARMFIRDLTILDAAYFDDFRGPLGASWQVDVELIGRRDAQGMLYDFRPCKQTIKRIIDGSYDHTLILPRDPNAGVDRLEYDCPDQALSRIPGATVTVAGIETAIKTSIEEAFREEGRDNVVGVDVTLREIPLPPGKAWYRYTHGLEKHDGNCQRLWHGHRNGIDIRVNGQADGELEHRLAALFFEAHIAYRENIVSTGDLRIGERQTHLEGVEIAYEASQGRFRAVIPGENVVVLPMECTVENIAAFCLEEVARERTGSLEVICYEGINKGARLTRHRQG